MTKHVTVMRLVTFLPCAAVRPVAAEEQTPIAAALQALESVHALSEVAVSPDGRHGSVVTGTFPASPDSYDAVPRLRLELRRLHDHVGAHPDRSLQARLACQWVTRSARRNARVSS
jgi:hypothetical protein